MNAKLLSLLCLLLLALHGHGQQNLETAFRMNGEEVIKAFEEPRLVLQSSSALIMDGRTEALYGVVVSRTGHVLTKASDFDTLQKPELVIDRKRYDQVRILAKDESWDVVLLKVDADGLVPVTYAVEIPVHGSWIVVNGVTTRFHRRALAGVISANPREIPAAGGAGLGVVLATEKNSVRIESVQAGSGAEQAGLQKGDVILSVAGKEVKSMKDIVETMKDRKAGESVKVVARRGKQSMDFDVKLASKAELFSTPEMKDRNDLMSGDYSKRRSGFPMVLQHDVLAYSKSMGGPIITLDGTCVGMNIARANRAETFGIPAKQLREIAERLMGQKPEPAEEGSPEG